MKKITTGQRIKEVMAIQKLRQVDILRKTVPYEEVVGTKVSKSHLSNYIADRSKPDAKKLKLLAMALGVSEPWLMGYEVNKTGRSKKTDDSEVELMENYRKLTQPRKDKASEFIAELLTEQQNVFKSGDWKKEVKEARLGTTEIPIKKSKNVLVFKKKDGTTIYPEVIGAAAGAGTSHYADPDFDAIMIPTDETYEDSYIMPMYVRGDSMEPKYFDGDVIWIDVNDKSISINQIGVFDTINGRVVKKMGVDELISLNRDYPDIELNEHMEFSTFGKVIDVIRREQLAEWQNAKWV